MVADINTSLRSARYLIRSRNSPMRKSPCRWRSVRFEIKPAEIIAAHYGSGAMTESRVAGLLAHLPDGLTEIYFHPATSNSFRGAAPGYRYTDELAALVAPEIVLAARGRDVRLVGYSDLAEKSGAMSQ